MLSPGQVDVTTTYAYQSAGPWAYTLAPGATPETMVKLVVAVIIAGLALFGMRQEPEKQRPYWLAAGILALVNIAVAVFWVAA